MAALASARGESTRIVDVLSRNLILLCVAHFFIDLYAAGLGTFQPYLVGKLGLTITQAGILAAILSVSSSLFQPFYGILSDRFPTRHFTVLAPAVAGLGIGLLVLAQNYWQAALLVFIGGAGIASFHPQASANATNGIRYQRARWMAVFISSGTLGMAIGPTFLSSLARWLTYPGAAWSLLPGVLMTAILWRYLPSFAGSDQRVSARETWAQLTPVLKPITIHYILVVLRSVVQISFTQFLPLYLVRERSFSVQDASFALSLYLGLGSVGGFMGGQLSDRFGGKRVILLSMIGCLPFLSAFFLTQGPVSLICLALGGMMLLFTIPVNVTMGQDLVEGAAKGTVSSLMMGAAWGMAGLLFIPLIGALADVTSLQTSLFLTLLCPAAGFFLTMLLPPDRKPA